MRKPSKDNKRYEMLEHDILTAKEEQTLGKKLRRAIKVKGLIAQLVEVKRDEQLERGLEEDDDALLQEMTSDLLLGGGSQSHFDDDDDEDLEGLSIYGMGRNTMQELEKTSFSAGSIYSRIDHRDLDQWDMDDSEVDSSSSSPFVSSGDAGATKHSDALDDMLTEDDIIQKLGIPGGRDELTRTLIYGSLARDKMISSNIRLVVSIAKKWFHISGQSGDANDHRLTTLYAGSWTRPSLDEAIQEGILGLATAADRFEPERNLKFGTYATYWITSFVRKCFQRAATGCLRVPPHYHVSRQNYQKIVKRHYQTSGGSPTVEEVAVEMGLTTQRLQFILKSTEALVSMDAPVTPGSLPGQGGKAGGETRNSFNDNNLLLGNMLSR
jgi:DNA-directed RNA polymerase sigma subunit (sigma70/sigma32)